jgi:hypothetical protein
MGGSRAGSNGARDFQANAFQWKLFQQMQHEGVQPDLVIFVGVLNACASAGVFMNRLFIEVLSLISLGF